MRWMTICAFALAAFVLLGASSGHAEDPVAQAREFAQGADLEDGKLIYLAGYNRKVERMQFLGGPQWLQMHGGSCASCHGPGGRGGMFPMQCDLRTPALDYPSLAAEKRGYDVDSLRIALEKSQDPQGERLDPCMPRWFLSVDDFRDLVAHLLALGGR